jgi:glycosyltransferase involved in cell wall biosynthesis
MEQGKYNFKYSIIYPKLSIIVPSYNQGEYLEETIISIVNQDYPNKELIIIDGGSTDNSVEVIRKYEKHITYWVSEKDNGQAHAINKGFEKATGDYIAWMNSDDIYYDSALMTIFSKKDIASFDFIYGSVRSGRFSNNASFTNSWKNEKFSLFNLLHFFYSIDYIIPSQSVFVRKAFLEENGITFLDESFDFCMDLEWYCRIALATPEYYKYREVLSFFRINQTTKTGSKNGIQQEAIQIFLNYRRYLKRGEEKRLFRTLYYHRVLKKINQRIIKNNLVSLSAILFKKPDVVSDKRFLGLVKKFVFKI